MVLAKLSFKRALRNGWQNIYRNPLLSAMTVFVIALIFFVFNVVLALNFAADSVIKEVGEKIDISAEILPEVEDYTIQTMLSSLRDIPEIKEVVYIPKKEALERLGAKYPNVTEFLRNNNLKNPLPDVIRIVGRDISSNNAILSRLEGSSFARIVNQEKLLRDQEQKTRNERLLAVTKFLKTTGFWLDLLFALVAMLILASSVTLTLLAHEKEISVMRLLGARTASIRNGYLVEGILLSVFALILSVIFSQAILGSLSQKLVAIIDQESILIGLNAILLHFKDRLWLTLVWQLFASAGLGALSSFLALQWYLKKTFSFS